MTNFVLQYPLLEDKSDRPYECEWCGDNFGGHKRKYCTPKCREEERRYDAYKEKQERYKKREIKKVEREKEKQEKRIAKLDKELAKLRQENKKFKCVVCDKELTGSQTLYCSDECSKLTRLDERKRLTPAESIFSEAGKWHEGYYGKCNVNIVESKNCLEVIDLTPYTYESDYYIEKCIIEDLPEARYTDGSCHINQIHKGLEFYYGPHYHEKAFNKDRKKSAIIKLVTLLKQRITQLEDGERKEPMVVNAD
jgi:hypothetical protein